MTNSIRLHLPEIEKICQEEGISYLALFGSHARGEETPDSDIDLLIDYDQPVGFFELYDTEEKLQKVFQKKIDLVTIGGLKKHLKPYIQPDLKVLYEKNT